MRSTILWTLALLGSAFLVLVSAFALCVAVIKPEFGTASDDRLKAIQEARRKLDEQEAAIVSGR